MSGAGEDLTVEQHSWPPRDARAYVKTAEFLHLLTEVASTETADRYGLAGGFAVLFDWFERRAEENDDFFAKKFESREHLRKYASVALKRVALRVAERRRREVPLEQVDVVELIEPRELGPLALASEKEFRVAAEQAISSLPVRQQKVFRLNVLEGVSLRETGMVIGCSPATAYRILEKALDSLFEKLRDFGHEPWVARRSGQRRRERRKKTKKG